jgi:GNAT superfamily N-acetyltransferase
MSEAKIVAYDPLFHKERTVQVFGEYRDWFQKEFKAYTNSDFFQVSGLKMSDYDKSVEYFLSLQPPEGMLLVTEVGEEIAGMGIIHKLSDDTGEVKRMLTCSQFRRRGFARKMLNRLLGVGRELGCTRFLLDSPRWATASHGLYRSSGFEEVDEYPESEIPAVIRQHWIFMEKIE